MPLVPCTGIFLGPSKSGKTVTLISLILEQHRGVFERIYIFSPSIDIDDGWIPVKKYIEQDLGVNTEREQAYWDEWDEAALHHPAAAQDHGGVQEVGDEVLIICDDLADVPQLRRPNGALDTLFIRGRHMQRSRAGQPAIALLLSALLPKKAALPVVRAGDAGTLQLPFRLLPEAEE